MPALLKKISGKRCVKILCNKFGFFVRRQKGSHIVLSKENGFCKTVAVVPNHRELKLGTLKGILKMADISEDEFAIFQ
jgi:predicted RNA binding protein YcfA (HicA-like mRNA interferase family)